MTEPATKNKTDESAKNRDFLQDNNAIKEESNKPYIATRIKSRNFLSNISYVGVTKQDFYNENFVFDVYVLLTKNLCPFSLVRKISDANKHDMIHLIWKECMSTGFFKYICEEENFMYLNGKIVIYSKVVDMISKFIETDTKNFVQLRDNVYKFKNIFQFVYSVTYPDIYCSTEKCGFDIKSTFRAAFKKYKDKKNCEQAGKNSKNFAPLAESSFEQKPIQVDELNSDDKRMIKENSKKRKRRKRDLAEKNSLLKKKKRKSKKK